jgi:hypothetical protein
MSTLGIIMTPWTAPFCLLHAAGITDKRLARPVPAAYAARRGLGRRVGRRHRRAAAAAHVSGRHQQRELLSVHDD